MDNRITALLIALALSVLAVCLFGDKKWFSIGWLGLTAGLMVLFKVLARMERGYLAFGEEFVAIGLVVALYSAVHSEVWLAWRAKRRNKRRLKVLQGSRKISPVGVILWERRDARKWADVTPNRRDGA